MTVYVAYAYNYDGDTVIIGVYSDRIKADNACNQWENNIGDCYWTDYTPYKVE